MVLHSPPYLGFVLLVSFVTASFIGLPLLLYVPSSDFFRTFLHGLLSHTSDGVQISFRSITNARTSSFEFSFVCLFVFVLSWKGCVFLLAVYIVSFSITSLDFLLECILNLLRILLRGCLLTCSFVYFFAGLAILINQLPATDKNGFLQTIVLSP